MEFTNKFKIRSQSVVDALMRDDYDLQEKPRNVFSATEIIDAVMIKTLQRRHWSEVQVDVSDNFHSMDGSAIHYVVERSNKKATRERLSEERIFIDCQVWTAHTLSDGEKITAAAWYNPDTYYVSVKFDCYDQLSDTEGVIEDYKRTSAREAVYGLKKERIAQLNIGAFGVALLGLPVTTVRACLFLKDWSRKELRAAEGRQSYYPAIPFWEFEEAAWSVETAKVFVTERLQMHVGALAVLDYDLPVCPAYSRWYRGESYAVIKEGNKVATKVFSVSDTDNPEDVQAAAQTHADQLTAEAVAAKKKGVTYKIEKRPGTNIRCEEYCAVTGWCHFYQKTYKNVEIRPEY